MRHHLARAHGGKNRTELQKYWWWVPDASRTVTVLQQLLSNPETFLAEHNAEYERIRARHANKKGQTLISEADARANKLALDWASYTPPAPKQLGRQIIEDMDLATLVPYIDWSPFLSKCGFDRLVSEDFR